jgi:hypothetical protein
MRSPWITNAAALRARMMNPAQLQAPSPEAEMPPYMESFLAHLRLLVGVPFDYLIADSRLLPVESIRFFYLDRSWTDRLVDGAISVGKIGTREQAHHQAHGAVVQQQLDVSENVVRVLQRGLKDFPSAKASAANDAEPADIVTGLLLRSAAVVAWPHMDVRAFRGNVSPGANPAEIDPSLMLQLLRLERLSPSVLIALFRGIPTMVWCEEPHHGVQFAIEKDAAGKLFIPARDASGHLIVNADVSKTEIPLPMRTGGRRVVAISQLRKDIVAKDQALSAQGLPHLPPQTGAAGFAISVLNPPWRQRFQGAGGRGAFQGGVSVTSVVDRPALTLAVKDLVK